jgi:hypothetical protein
MTNSASAVEAIASMLTVRTSGSDSGMPNSDTTKPAKIAMIIGLRTSPPSDRDSTFCQRSC